MIHSDLLHIIHEEDSASLQNSQVIICLNDLIPCPQHAAENTRWVSCVCQPPTDYFTAPPSVGDTVLIHNLSTHKHFHGCTAVLSQFSVSLDRWVSILPSGKRANVREHNSCIINRAAHMSPSGDAAAANNSSRAHLREALHVSGHRNAVCYDISRDYFADGHCGSDVSAAHLPPAYSAYAASPTADSLSAGCATGYLFASGNSFHDGSFADGHNVGDIGAASLPPAHSAFDASSPTAYSLSAGYATGYIHASGNSHSDGSFADGRDDVSAAPLPPAYSAVYAASPTADIPSADDVSMYVHANGISFHVGCSADSHSREVSADLAYIHTSARSYCHNEDPLLLRPRVHLPAQDRGCIVIAGMLYRMTLATMIPILLLPYPRICVRT